jgi:hypothetical protein
MSVLRRTWVVPLAVAIALTLLPTPLTGDYPPPPDPPPPDYDDPGGPGDGFGGAGCYRLAFIDPGCPSNYRWHLVCPGWFPIPLGCV